MGECMPLVFQAVSLNSLKRSGNEFEHKLYCSDSCSVRSSNNKFVFKIATLSSPNSGYDQQSI